MLMSIFKDFENVGKVGLNVYLNFIYIIMIFGKYFFYIYVKIFSYFFLIVNRF